MSAPRKIRTWFTLVELLVVVAIISILASLLMPAISGALAQARSLSCLNNLKQLTLAQEAYALDSNDKIIVGKTGSTYPLESWSEYLLYLGYVPGTPVTTSKFKFAKKGIGCCPDWGWYGNSSYFQWEWHGTYGSNVFLSNWNATNYIAKGSIAKPSNTMFMADKYDFTNPGEVAESFYNYFGTGGRVGPWHKNGSNLAFIDGHAKYYATLPKRATSVTHVEPWKP